MKKFAFLAACAIAFTGCSDDGMSLDDFCAAVVGCQSSGFTSADDCKMKIRSRAAQYPDCTVAKGLAVTGSDAQNNPDKVHAAVTNWLAELGF